MFARVSTIQGSPAQISEGIRQLEQSAPAIARLAGFKGAYLLADRAAGNIVTITLWESAQAAQASREVADREHGQAARAAGAAPPQVAGYEVVLAPPPAR